MLLSLLVGVIVYMVAQFLWYSPFGFGVLWRRYQKDVPSKIEEPVALPAFIPPTVRMLVFPAVTVSIALHVLRVVTRDLDESGFFVFVILLWFLVVSGKYFRKADVLQRKKWSIEDGALLCSLLLVALVVVVWWRTV